MHNMTQHINITILFGSFICLIDSMPNSKTITGIFCYDYFQSVTPSCSIILSSHLLPDVEAVCDQAILLNEGRVLFCGPIAEMHEQQRDTYEVKVKAHPERLVKALVGADCTAELTDGTLMVQLPEGADPDLIFARAMEADLQVRHLTPMRQSLESAFVRLLEHEGPQKQGPDQAGEA